MRFQGGLKSRDYLGWLESRESTVDGESGRMMYTSEFKPSGRNPEKVLPRRLPTPPDLISSETLQRFVRTILGREHLGTDRWVCISIELLTLDSDPY